MWLVVYVGLVVVGSLAKVVDERVGERPGIAVSFVGGLLLGGAWYVLYPRDLASRLFGLMLFTTLVFLVLLILPGSEVVSDPDGTRNALGVTGVLSGLVLTEKFREGADPRDRRRARFRG